MRNHSCQRLCLALFSLVLLLGGSLRASAQIGDLTATVSTDRGCGTGAVYQVGELASIHYSVSRDAVVTLRVQLPTGEFTQLLTNQPVPGGFPRSILGQIGTDPGQRRIILDAVAGTQQAHAECTFTAQGTMTPVLTATLTTSRGCGGGASFQVGELVPYNYSVSTTALVTVRLHQPNGVVRTLWVNQLVPGGELQESLERAEQPEGQYRLALEAIAGPQTARVECTYTVGSGGPPPAQLTATLETNKGCGPGAVYDLNELTVFRYSVSQTAQVTLRLDLPDGSSRVLVNETIPGGALQTITGRIGLPLGQRRLVLDAVAGTQTAHVECTYTTSGATPPPGQLTATLTTNRGCGPAAVFALGETSIFQYSVSQTALVTLRLVFPDGSSRVLVNQTIPGGVLQSFAGTIGNPLGQRRLILDAVAGTQSAHVECTYSAGGTTPPPGQTTLSLSIDKGCGAQYRVGETITVTYSASFDANMTMFIQDSNGRQSIIFTESAVVAGRTYSFTNSVAPGATSRTIILRPTALLPPVNATCSYTIVP